MEITKISSKGQLVIPSKIRNELEIEDGNLLVVDRVKDMIVIKKVDINLVQQFKNSLEDLKRGRIKRVA
ncbi:MAG TPA: AbrB/MazE/SpoVT family DNA-binding domain-containing protein [Candidatus Paceibacterota bacterium]|nr:AbrB/MazE/SpoVT family DNA-binding domain-containing protein [Candidatus Paceibacterota bacterium]